MFQKGPGRRSGRPGHRAAKEKKARALELLLHSTSPGKVACGLLCTATRSCTATPFKPAQKIKMPLGSEDVGAVQPSLTVQAVVEMHSVWPRDPGHLISPAYYGSVVGSLPSPLPPGPGTLLMQTRG